MGSVAQLEQAQMSSEAIVSMAVSDMIPLRFPLLQEVQRLLAQLSNAPRSRLARHPKVRGIVMIASLLKTLLLWLPLWALQYSLKRNRPRRNWNLGRCLRVRWSRSLCELVAKCELDTLGRDLSKDLVRDASEAVGSIRLRVAGDRQTQAFASSHHRPCTNVVPERVCRRSARRSAYLEGEMDTASAPPYRSAGEGCLGQVESRGRCRSGEGKGIWI